MYKLYGSPISNYHNKVKLALLEKGIEFEEVSYDFRQPTPEVLAMSPLGKIPFLLTPQGAISESDAILEFLDRAHPETPLLPADPFEAAKVRELCIHIDLYLEWVARDLYPKAFFGGNVSDGLINFTRKRLDKNIAAFKQLAQFSPFVAGDTFTRADCSAIVSLTIVGLCTKAVYGEDLLLTHGVDTKAYLARMAERASVQRVNAERKAASAAAKA